MTPLSTISTLAQGMMRRTTRLTTDDVQERSEKILARGLRVKILIETILSYTRINAGALNLNLSVFKHGYPHAPDLPGTSETRSRLAASNSI